MSTMRRTKARAAARSAGSGGEWPGRRPTDAGTAPARRRLGRLAVAATRRVEATWARDEPTLTPSGVTPDPRPAASEADRSGRRSAEEVPRGGHERVPDPALAAGEGRAPDE